MPEDNKAKHERGSFYDRLQNIIESISQNDLIIILGDFNAHINNEVIPGVKQRFNENTLNDNGELLINLYSPLEQYMSSQTTEVYEKYKRIRKDTKSLVKQAKDKHWEIFSKRMQSDFYGLQKQI